MEKGPFEDVCPIKSGDFPLPYQRVHGTLSPSCCCCTEVRSGADLDMSNHTMLDGLQFVMLAVFSFRFPRIGPSSHPKLPTNF